MITFEIERHGHLERRAQDCAELSRYDGEDELWRTADLEMKEILLARDPAMYFTIPHFDGYPAVLVRLPKIKIKELRDLIEEAWLARAPKKAAQAYLKK